MSVEIDPDAVSAIAQSILLSTTGLPPGKLNDIEACGSGVAAAAATEFAVWRDFAWGQLHDSLSGCSKSAHDAVKAYHDADASVSSSMANSR